jgi:hypothetical protein
MDRHALQAGGEQSPFDRTWEAQIPPAWRSERHKKGRDYLPPLGQIVDSGREMAKNNSLKIDDRLPNVYENKGALWKTRGRSRNVIENKYSYANKAGMLLKIQVVSSAAQTCSLVLGLFLQPTPNRQIGSALPLIYWGRTRL